MKPGIAKRIAEVGQANGLDIDQRDTVVLFTRTADLLTACVLVTADLYSEGDMYTMTEFERAVRGIKIELHHTRMCAR